MTKRTSSLVVPLKPRDKKQEMADQSSSMKQLAAWSATRICGNLESSINAMQSAIDDSKRELAELRRMEQINFIGCIKSGDRIRHHFAWAMANATSYIEGIALDGFEMQRLLNEAAALDAELAKPNGPELL